MRPASLAVAVLCAIACGPDEAQEVARFEDVCGEPGPFRLLELDDGEQLLPGSRKIGERFYFVVGPSDGATTRVIATGLCGEAPVEIARDVFVVFEDDRWPGGVFGCVAGDDKVVLDPQGVESPRVVSLAPACRGTPTDLGVVGVVERDAATRALALAPYPSDLAAPAVPSVVLAESIRGEPFFPDYLVRGSAAYTVTPTHDLLRIDLATATSVVEQPGVAEWGVSADERTLAWRDVALHVDGDAWSVGTLMLRDRTDGREVGFDGVSLQSIPPGTYDPKRIVLTVESDAGVFARFVELPSLEVRDFPGEHRLMWELSDGRLLMKSSFDGPYHLLDPVTGEETRLSDLRSAVMRSGTDSFEIFVGSALDGSNESELWRVPYNGSGDTKLAHRVISLLQFDLDGRIVTPLDLDDDHLGDLVTIDPESLHEELVDERVVASLGPHGKTFGLHPREIVYGVVDGERSGVWIARLAP